MVKDHSDSEKGNPLPPHRLLFPICQKQQGFFYMHHTTDRIAHTTAFGTPIVEHWLEREITRHGAQAGTRNNSTGPQCGIDLKIHHTMSRCWTTELHLAPVFLIEDNTVGLQNWF